MSQTFTSVDDQVLCEVIAQARERLVFVAPGLRPPVAEALALAMARVPSHAVHIVLDVDAEVCRLGYGDKDFKGMEILQAAAAQHALTVNHHPGIRIGLLIADETTLMYSPTPELIETESRQPDKPNAILLRNALPAQLADACAVGATGFATLEIGKDPVDKRAVEAVKKDLSERPPKEFNVARIERVFSSMLHYVEWKISGYKLASRTITLKPELFGLTDKDVVRRLTNRYLLFSETSSLTLDIPHVKDDGNIDPNQPKVPFGPLSIDQERKRIKECYVIEGGGFGTLMLRRDVRAFENEITVLKARIEAYRLAVAAQIEARKAEIVEELLRVLFDRLRENPPARWRSRCFSVPPSDDDIKRLFGEEVDEQIGKTNKVFKPTMSIVYKDVTYNTFKNPAFQKLMASRFGAHEVHRIFREYDAAPETPLGETQGWLLD